MKHIWKVDGVFLDWELTVRVRPAQRPPMPITESDQGAAIGRLRRLGQHFDDLVRLHEYELSVEHVVVGPGQHRQTVGELSG